MKRYISLILLFLAYGALVKAQQTAQTFVQQMHYLLYLPQQYAGDTTRRWPLVLFLHGSGETGDSLQLVTRNGPPKLVKEGKLYPFILVSPQAKDYRWYPHELKALLDDIQKRFRVDGSRIYVTGLSMGGFGAWALAEEYPDEFAAVLPLSGGGDTSKAWKLRYLPVWAFHGLKDQNVPPANSINMISALRPYQPGAKLTLYPDLGHDTWTTTYSNDSVYTWMLAQKRVPRKAVALPESLLKEYAGTYVDGPDTAVVTVNGDALIAKHGNNNTPLIPAQKDVFYIDANSSAEVRFQRDASGKVVRLAVWINDQEIYRKISDDPVK